MTAGFTLTTLGSVFTAFTAAVVRGVTGAAAALFKTIAIIPSVVRGYLNRGPVLEMLDMDDRMLRDIGITRMDITSALAASPLGDPSTRLRIYAVERRAGNRAQARERYTEMLQAQTPKQLTLPLAAKPCAAEAK
jgi:uncharacterized protein YjiS (DUF1127 family)